VTVAAPRLRALALLVVLLVVLTGCGQGDGSTGGGATASATGAAATQDAGAQDVSIVADGLDLVGTLRLPEGPPPHPGVTIVHGSGPVGRRGSMRGQLGLTLPTPVPVYEELAQALQSRGYAVLTYDKRTCGPFNGCADNDYPMPPDDLTLDTFTQDADAALDHLASRDDVSDLAVIGHSQGGTVAMQVAAGRDDLDAVVLLATPAVPIDEVVAAQADTLEALVAAAGQQGSTADQALAGTRALAEGVTAIDDGATEGPDVGGASRTFWASWIAASREAPQLAAAEEPPVLVIGGEHDWNALPEQVRAWESHLGTDSRVEILPGLTHALTRLDTDDLAAITPDDVGTGLDPSVVDTIATWFDSTLDPESS
jgi:pimeloyl-ACP methyl ester carboxylesterase